MCTGPEEGGQVWETMELMEMVKDAWVVELEPPDIVRVTEEWVWWSWVDVKVVVECLVVAVHEVHEE